MFDDKLVVLDSLLKQAGHEKWGWHIYRCTYSSDDDRSEFMKRLKSLTQRMIDSGGGTYNAVAKQLVWTVVEDCSRLENATKSDVRRMFRDWVNGPEAAAEQPNAKFTPSTALMSRYLYCVHVDEKSLRSVLDDSHDWHVNLVSRRWVSEEEHSDAEEFDDDEDVPDEEQEAYILPEIEGCVEEDVGWTKASEGILVGRYVSLCDPNFWCIYYSRPPHRAI
jgi:hypothetical protein